MKKTLFLTCLLSSLSALPTYAAYGIPSLDNATGYAYNAGGIPWSSETSASWTTSNMTIAKNTNGTLSITRASSSGYYGSGYNATIVLTLDLSKLTTPAGYEQVFRLGNYWGLARAGTNSSVPENGAFKPNNATTAPAGSFVPTWTYDGTTSYYNGSAISVSSSGLLTLVMTTSESGTKLADSNLKEGGTDTGLKGSTVGNASTITIGSYAADALVGIAAWNKTVYGNNIASAICAYNSLAENVTGSTPIKWQNQAFVSRQPEGTPSLGRVTFIGDSITEGVNDQTWRYQLFKNLVDNGIEFEIAGLREGYDSSHLPANPETEYGGVEFVNSHLAKSSGRTYGLINNGTTTDSVSGVANVTSSNVAYGYTITDAAALNSDTYIMMIGTNDLLSDTTSSAGTAAYAAVMQNLLGGTVQYANGNYSWTSGDDIGNMGTLLDTLKLAEANDTVYLMTVPTWSRDNPPHGSHSAAREAVRQYNGLLGQWVEAYNSNNTGANVKLIDINDGLVDVTKGNFEGVQSFFNASDGVHPNEQGSLIIAGNLAQGMGLDGRTAGQARLTASELGQQAGNVTVSADNAYTTDPADFSFDTGTAYTISLETVFGNGSVDGWSATDVLSIRSGNGSVSGTLNISEGYISWGQDILFSRDMSRNSEAIRIAYITGDKDKANRAEGYYVWLNDKLIGEGLQATADSYNGLSITSSLETTVKNLAYDNGSYAPVKIDNGGDFSSASAPAAPSGAIYAVDAAGVGDATVTTSANALGQGHWYGGMGGSVNHTGNIAMEIKGEGNSVFGVVNTGTLTGNVTIVLNDSNASLSTFSGTVSVVGAYAGKITGTFKFIMNQGAVSQDIYGGAYTGNNTQTIGATSIIVNGGSVGGSIYGGSTYDVNYKAVEHDANIQITGGVVNGSVYGGGKAGTIGGNTNVEIDGGEIKGSVYGGSTTGSYEKNRVTYNTKGTITGTKNVIIRGGIIRGNVSGGDVGETNVGNVTIIGNNARIGGTISAEHVTLKDLAASGRDLGFDTYANAISAGTLTLEDVTVNSLAASFENVSSLEVLGSTNTNMVLADTVTLTNLKLAGGTTLGIYKNGAAKTASTDNEVTVTVTQALTAEAGATLNANLVFSAGSTMCLDGTLTMGSSVYFVNGMLLEGSLLSTLYGSGIATLYDSVDQFYVNSEQWNDGDSWTGDEGSANILNLFTNLNHTDARGNEYRYGLSYTGGSIVLTASVPEPATATLSLLALAALAAHRRRK